MQKLNDHQFSLCSAWRSVGDAVRSCSIMRWSPGGKSDGIALVVIVFVFNLLLRQDAIHHVDANALVRALAMPSTSHAHFGVMWVLHGVRAWVGESEPIYRSILTVGSAFAALAVGVAHRAFLLSGLPRFESFCAALGVASNLGWSHFATVVEIHAFCLPFAAWFWFSLGAHWCDPKLRFALTAGIASGFATAIHYSCAVLPMLGILALSLNSCRRVASVRSRFSDGIVLFLAHSATFFGLQALDSVLLGTADNAETLSWIAGRCDVVPGLWSLVGVAWGEWFLPFAPWSFGFLVALRFPRLRAAAFFVLAGWLVYIGADLIVLQGWEEKGAYALPMSIPTVALCVFVWQRRLVLCALMMSFSLAIGNHFQQDPSRVPHPEFGLALQDYVEGHPGTFLVLGGYEELDSVLVYCRPTPSFSVFEVPFTNWLSPSLSNDDAVRAFSSWLESVTVGESSVLFSVDAIRTLIALPRGRYLIEQCRVLFDAEVVRIGARDGWLVSSVR